MHAKKDISARSLAVHRKMGGKIRIAPVMPVRTRGDLSVLYTPGVGAVASLLARHPARAREYTIKGKMVAVISDGSAVLGLGNIGPLGALPVMEGKCVLFKEFAGVDAFPIVLNTQDPDRVVEAIVAIAPGFGGINLEDFAAPQCFEIEERVKRALDIPVMHDDQHGTAIVVLAALMNAATAVNKRVASLRVVIVGAGAAGSAIARLLLQAGVKDVVVCDSKGIINRTRAEKHKRDLARATNPRRIRGGLFEALAGADAVIGVSGPNSIAKDHIAAMGPSAIVFALANPMPEIMPEDAREAGARIIATGRSDYPNQVNNVLAFPGIFRGALDNRVRKISDGMKLRAAKNLAALVDKPTPHNIIPEPFDPRVVPAVARAIR